MRFSTAMWFAMAGAFGVTRWVLEFPDPQYFDPESVLDYTTVYVQSAAGVATGIALLTLWRNPPVRRGSILLVVAGLAAITHGMGNLLEDAFEVESGELGFFVGGIAMMLGLLGAGIVALTVKSPLRWSGLFLVVGATGGLLGAGLLSMGLAWLGFSIWIVVSIKRTAHVVAPSLEDRT